MNPLTTLQTVLYQATGSSQWEQLGKCSRLSSRASGRVACCISGMHAGPRSRCSMGAHAWLGFLALPVRPYNTAVLAGCMLHPPPCRPAGGPAAEL